MTKQITPLRQRMLDDMALRNMSPATQRVYINTVKSFSEPRKPFKPNRKRYYVGVTVRKRSDTAAEIGSTARSSPGLAPVRHGRPAPFPLHDGARWRVAHLLAKSPDWLKAARMWENLLASWHQSGRKQGHCPSLLNHNAKYKRLLPPFVISPTVSDRFSPEALLGQWLSAFPQNVERMQKMFANALLGGAGQAGP